MAFHPNFTEGEIEAERNGKLQIVWKDTFSGWCVCIYVYHTCRVCSSKIHLSVVWGVSLYLCVCVCVCVCVCAHFYMIASLCPFVCVCMHLMCVFMHVWWKGKRKMRRGGNEGKLVTEEINAMCKIMQILCLTERKKITKICKSL